MHEGKNEINARVGYFKLGVNLNTEIPTVLQLRKAVQEVLENEAYKNNINRLCREFDNCQPLQLCTNHIADVLNSTRKPMIAKL